jgi:hypothetical protein
MKTKAQLQKELDSMVSSYAYLVKVIEEQEQLIMELSEEGSIIFSPEERTVN